MHQLNSLRSVSERSILWQVHKASIACRKAGRFCRKYIYLSRCPVCLTFAHNNPALAHSAASENVFSSWKNIQTPTVTLASEYINIPHSFHPKPHGLLANYASSSPVQDSDTQLLLLSLSLFVVLFPFPCYPPNLKKYRKANICP